MIRDQHIPILTNEIEKLINNKKNLFILDCTFGGGGHSIKFLERGHDLTAIDQDDNSKNIAKILKKKFSKISFYKSNFKDLDILRLKTKRFDFILLDLGFSSNQLDDNDVGLSFKINSNLNMNYLGGDLNAYKIINYYNKEELQRVFYSYGEINQSEKLAKYIINERSKKKINTNYELIEILRNSGVNFRSKKIHFATQAFQALRIESNNELENLIIFLEKVHNFLKINGYLAIISFHSLEDRIVKNYFRDNKVTKNKKFQNNKDWGFENLTKKPLVASKFEIIKNKRSRSAKLRVGRFIN
mgnify:CR=1 FL=1|tara:strand:- start:3060 stop:3962 length:903 start_codon:yes stop_codon:yes gene_type:complete